MCSRSIIASTLGMSDRWIQWRIQDLQTGGGARTMRRREDQGAAGAEGVGCKNPILDLKMATLGAF